jgi:hypothetical protein
MNVMKDHFVIEQAEATIYNKQGPHIGYPQLSNSKWSMFYFFITEAPNIIIQWLSL